MLPEPARDLLGYWKGNASRRLTSQSNRYSRDGERVLQYWLRSLILRWISTRLPPFEKRPLEAFTASLLDVAALDTEWQTVCKQAASLVFYRHVSMSLSSTLSLLTVSGDPPEALRRPSGGPPETLRRASGGPSGGPPEYCLVAARRGEESSALGSG